MSHAKNKIELNGRVYDVTTGKAVSHVPSKAPAKHHNVKKRKHLNMDGVVNKAPSSYHTSTLAKHSQDHTDEAPSVDHSKKLHVSQTETTHLKPSRAHNPADIRHHKPQKTKTLMRGVVHRPEPRNLEKQSRQQNTVIKSDNQARLERAKNVVKSSQISRFPSGAFAVSSSTASYKHLPVAEPPKALTQNVPAHHSTTRDHHANKQASHTNHQKTKQEHIFEKAMSQSNTHKSLKTTHHHKRTQKTKFGLKRSTYNTAAGALAVLLFVGFVMYQNIPNLSMRIASTRAGFSASLPNYNPSGFGMSGPVEYSAGKVAVNFKSTTDERNYSLKQQVSNWNSQALVDNYIDANGKEYQTFQEKGKTIYVYDDSSASWVSGGVWYEIEGAGSLNTDQLLRIASSI